LQSYRIIVCSIVTYGRLIAQSDFDASHITHLFIDEAAQTVEPELLIPIVHLIEYNELLKICLAGDPAQLGAIIHSPLSKQYGLEQSLLERLINNTSYLEKNEYNKQQYNESYCVKLINNYRSHRAIIEVPKTLFYGNELNECAGEFRNLFTTLKWPLLPNKNFPLIFHPVYGKEEREGSSPSYFNISEVETINKYLTELLDSKVRDKKLKFLDSSQIGIITPYRGQVQKIKDVIKEKKYGEDILVGSPEDFQGQVFFNYNLKIISV
jgi:helicase MOV-10